MAVISNTSPILALSAIGHLDLLEAQFGEVLIPEAVQAELKTDTDFRGAKHVRQALKEGWLRVQVVENAYLAQALAMDLDYGEAEAIALTLETRSQVILLDEHDGRLKARAMGLQPIGVLGALISMHERSGSENFEDEAHPQNVVVKSLERRLAEHAELWSELAKH